MTEPGYYQDGLSDDDDIQDGGVIESKGEAPAPAPKARAKAKAVSFDDDDDDSGSTTFDSRLDAIINYLYYLGKLISMNPMPYATPEALRQMGRRFQGFSRLSKQDISDTCKALREQIALQRQQSARF